MKTCKFGLGIEHGYDTEFITAQVLSQIEPGLFRIILPLGFDESIFKYGNATRLQDGRAVIACVADHLEF